MKRAKSLTMVVGATSLALAGAAALGKAHDQGVADGTRVDPSNLRGGVVAGVNTPGIGAEGFAGLGLCGEGLGFCGVVGDDGQTYGQTIVSVQRELGIRRVTPVQQPGQNKPPLAD